MNLRKETNSQKITEGRFCLRTSLDGSKSCRSNEKCEEYHLPLVYSTETYEKCKILSLKFVELYLKLSNLFIQILHTSHLTT